MSLFGRDTRNESHSFELDGATSAQAEIDMAVGELYLNGGAPGLMQGAFEFDESLAPQISHQLQDGRAMLSVVQSKGARALKTHKNRWDIALTDAIPLDVAVRMATGRCQVDLASARLSTVTLQHTTGDMSVNLGGHQLALTEVNIKQATGRTTLDLDGDYANLRTLRLVATTGETIVNMAGGAWGRDLDARVEVTTGATILRLPRDVGVEARVKTSIGKVVASDFHYDGDAYRNDACGSSAVTLRLIVTASIGKVTLEAGD